MTVVLDRNGAPITVGARVLPYPSSGAGIGTVTPGGVVLEITDPDGDVNEHGRPVARGPYVVVGYDDNSIEKWTATWNATGPWDDDRDDYTCDDVEVAP